MSQLCTLLFLVTLHVVDSAIDLSLIKELSNGVERKDVLVNFKDSNSPVLSLVDTLQSNQIFDSELSRVKTLVSLLEFHALNTQATLLEFTKLVGLESKSFWAGNQMIVKNANLAEVQQMNEVTGVGRIQKVPIIQLNPIPASGSTVQTESGLSWGVNRIMAQQAWGFTRGEDVVVGGIDTGVRGSHQDLRDNFRSDHGWWDPSGNFSTPTDNNGHGTHTMGTIVGKNGIGVAPGAQWIACKGCQSDSCDGESLLACGNWMMKPTNPDGTDPNPSLKPDVVSCSWGGPLHDDWYDSILQAWTAAGIVPVFAIGNQGPGCVTCGSPGDSAHCPLAVGATNSDDSVASYSSQGPTASTFIIKPDVAAPGTNIRSAWNTGDSDYNEISGTSMATPHVAGLVALAKSRDMMLDKTRSVSDYANIIKSTSDRHMTQFPLCSNTPISFGNILAILLGTSKGSSPYPNNAYGNGIVNAEACMNAL